MIIIPASYKQQFEDRLKIALTDNKFREELVLSGHEVTCTIAKKIINDYQFRIETADMVKNGQIDHKYLMIDSNKEHAYSLIPAEEFAQIILTLQYIGALYIRLYFAMNEEFLTTIAIVGQDSSGKPLMPQDGTGKYYVYENFGGGGSIDSADVYGPDLYC